MARTENSKILCVCYRKKKKLLHFKKISFVCYLKFMYLYYFSNKNTIINYKNNKRNLKKNKDRKNI